VSPEAGALNVREVSCSAGTTLIAKTVAALTPTKIQARERLPKVNEASPPAAAVLGVSAYLSLGLKPR